MLNETKLRLILSDDCTQNCIFCSKDFNKNKSMEMSIEHAFNCIDSFKDINGDTVCLSGGEPTLYKYFSELLAYIKKNTLKVQLTTNGTLIQNLTDTQLQNIDIIHISLNSIDIDNYKLIARPENEGSFNQILCNLERLLNLNITFTINTVYLDEFPDEIEKIISLSKIKGFNVQIMNNMFAGSQYFMKYLSFIDGICSVEKNIRVRRTTNPQFQECSECINKCNCASTRAIWCFPNMQISVCPYQKNLINNHSNINEQVKRAYNFITSNSGLL